jgi:signal transduction histidine kinase
MCSRNIYIWILLLFLSSSQYGYSQIIDAKITEEQRYPIITGSVTFINTQTPVPFNSLITKRSQYQFKKVEDKPVIIDGYGPDYYWFRLVIANTDSCTKRLMLLLGPTGMKDGELIQVHKNKYWSLGKTGYKYRFIKRPYQYMHYVYPITIERASLDTFYVREDYHIDYKLYGFALIQQPIFKSFENRVYVIFGMIIGLLSLFLVFNLFAYFFLKDKVQLWYVLYIAMLILLVMKNDQLDEQFLGTDSEAGFRSFHILAVGAIAIAVLMHVVQLYLKNISKKSVLYKTTFILKCNLLLIGIIQFLIFKYPAQLNTMSIVFNWADNSTTIGIVFIILNCVYSTYKGFKPALFILAGLGGFLLGSIQKLLLLPTATILFPPCMFHIGMMIEVVTISFGFIYTYRKEKEHSKQLENNYKQELNKAQLEIQEQTFKNIGQEIHDNIGQVLSLAKLNVNTMDCSKPTQLKERIISISELLSKAIQDLRDLSKSLHTDCISEMGLVKAIQYECELIKKISDYDAMLHVHGKPYSLPQQQELILFRIFQEVVNNTIKHAKASIITVHVYYQQNDFIMDIADNGTGFNIFNLDENKQGIGIRNMQNRARLIGAEYKMESAIGKGTTVIIKLPVESNALA